MYRNEQKSFEEIVKYFDNPIVNIEFVRNAIDITKFLKSFPRTTGPWKTKKKYKTVPVPGTRMRKVWDKVDTIGGLTQFQELLKTRALRSFAVEWGFSYNDMTNYKRNYIDGQRKEARYRPQIRTIMMNMYRAGLKRRPMKADKKKTLW